MKLVFLFAVLATSVVKEVSAFPQQFCYSYNLVEHQCDDAEVQIIEIPTAVSSFVAQNKPQRVMVGVEPYKLLLVNWAIIRFQGEETVDIRYTLAYNWDIFWPEMI